MILYTENQLDDAWRSYCKKQSSLDRPWMHRDKYRELFEACLDIEVAGMGDRTQYYLQTFDIEIPQEILESIRDTIDLELDLNDEH